MRSFLILLALAAPAPLCAQAAAAVGFAASLDDGTIVVGQPVGLTRSGARVVLRWELPDGQVRDLALDRVLGLHGAPPVAPDGAVVRLCGGDELVGALAAGDTAGERFVLRSRSLGDVPVAIDRLDHIVFPARAAGAGAEVFVLGDDAPGDEALFRPAPRGFDSDFGAIHRFLDDAVLFAIGDREPVARPFEQLAAIALRGGDLRQDQPPARLLTRSGDRLGVELVAIDERGITFELENRRETHVAFADVSAIAFEAPGRTFLSRLPLVRAEERGWFADGNEPLLPFRLDRSVSGGPLRAGGRAWASGLGVHSFAELTWRVPEGAQRFWTAVAIDDEVLGLEVRGDARVLVKRGEAIVFEGEVRSGGELLRIGPLPVAPRELLTLVVDFGAGLDLGDRVDWLGAVFLP